MIVATMLGVVVWLATPAASHATPYDRCTVRLSPRDDVQQAIDRIPGHRRSPCVCLGPGEFRIPRFIAIARDGLTLRGAGPSTILRLDDGVESPVIVAGDYAHETPRGRRRWVTIERLRIIGGGRAGSEHHREYPYLTNSAVVVRAGSHIVIRDLDVTDCRSACILTERDTRDVSIERNRLSRSVWDGISLNRTERARVAGNDIRDNTAGGITTEHLVDSVIEGNVVAANKTHGLYLSDSYRNRIVANRFVDNVLSGVFVTCAVRQHAPEVRCWDDSMSQGNRFTRNTFTGNRVGFTAAPNAAATCTKRRFVANRSSADRFSRNPRDEPGPRRYGRCLRFDD